jgi:8-oxo-dGTP pyrophosphatase MutT (NUDIX family)
MKKRGFGVGKWNGVGGKVEEGEDISAAAAREVKEEIGIDVASSDLQKVGALEFRFDNNPEWAQGCHVFLVKQWTGEPTESDEMRPQWYPIDRLPFGAMWIDDPHWLPLVLAGKRVKGKFTFTERGDELLAHEVSILS